jgi:hypothetical protein
MLQTPDELGAAPRRHKNFDDLMLELSGSTTGRIPCFLRPEQLHRIREAIGLIPFAETAAERFWRQYLERTNNLSDFLDRLNDQQRAAYVDGAIEMLAYGMEGQKASRALDWFYRGRGPEQLAAALKQHRDLPVTGILQVLVKRICS